MTESPVVPERIRAEIEDALVALQEPDGGTADAARTATRRSVLDRDPSIDALSVLFNSLAAASLDSEDDADPVL